MKSLALPVAGNHLTVTQRHAKSRTMAYTKLFNSIITSTIWSEDDKTRIVWITMLASADRNGEVQASIPGLARIAGVSVEACEVAIAKFLAPDKHSRTKDDEGRRIETIDGGWSLLNHKKYRDMASDDDRKKAAAERQQRARDKKARNSHASVTPESRQISHADADAESREQRAEGESEAELERALANENLYPQDPAGNTPPIAKPPRQRVERFAPPTLDEVKAFANANGVNGTATREAQKFHDYFSSNGWRVGRNPMKDWRAAFRNWLSRSADFAPASGTAPRKSAAEVAREMGVGR